MVRVYITTVNKEGIENRDYCFKNTIESSCSLSIPAQHVAWGKIVGRLCLAFVQKAKGSITPDALAFRLTFPKTQVQSTNGKGYNSKNGKKWKLDFSKTGQSLLVWSSFSKGLALLYCKGY